MHGKDVGDLIHYETVPDGKHYTTPTVMDLDQFDKVQIYELFP
eukprot:CAMPEP_0168728856 /NCGR_PEP_ID=MMETSP0724-20121128/5898_1 /TAXON_ID=265536 /ORGANISM="Amphiprora sp., Strain CCMP467" /LENGTH=42 /DNA_ID= /DNA_START= /DNA_END= /DNA_ORIENTATION=